MTDFTQAIGQFGFPIVVAGYLLFRIENKMEKLTDAINQNTRATDRLVITVKSLRETIKNK